MKFKYPVLSATLAVLALVSVLCVLTLLTIGQALCVLTVWQLALLAYESPRGELRMAMLSQQQIDEFEEIMRGMKGYEDVFKDIANAVRKHGSIEAAMGQIPELQRKIKNWIKGGAGSGGGGIRMIGDLPFIPDEHAKALTAGVVCEIGRNNPGALATLIRDAGTRERVTALAAETLGFGNVRTALDPTTTPLPTIYMPTIVELVWKYGQARQYGTVYPLGAGVVKLPRLKAGEDSFSYLGIGTAGMSQAVAEKRVTAELVTFTANKAGGLIRIPTEIEEDTFIPLGQFLARYIARQFAKLEDSTMFLGDGTATYADITGIGPYCVANPTYLQQLGAGKTKPTDATLNDFRAIRGKVNPAALVDEPAYYMNPTMEALLVTFNTIGSPLIYRPAVGPGQPATLDGFPIRWVGSLQPYATTAAPSAFLAMFGALKYWYLGERGTPRIEISREVFFASDEVAMRALERIDVEAMAIDAMTTLQTAAA